MEQTDDLKLIKKYYGENMMHLCRSLFPTILEKPGKLFELISSRFNYSKFLYDDIIREKKEEKFKDFIYNLFDPLENSEIVYDKTPQELLEEKGYILYECKTKEDINRFIKYYQPNERLCTFGESGELGRLKRCFVFFAVKKNVDEIKRGNFKEPSREDEYGTSVISIQFSRGEVNTLSIKNRYNHTVPNPDATFSNDLELINKGLTIAFSKHYNLNIKSNQMGFELDKYVLADDDKFYKYNYERDNIYYCPDNIIIDNFMPKKYDKEKYIIFDHYVLDLVDKKLFVIETGKNSKENEAFLNSVGEIKSIKVNVDKKKHKKKIIINNDIIILLNDKNQLIGYKNTHVKEIGNSFLKNSSSLKILILSNVEKLGDDALISCPRLELVDLSSLKELGDHSFLYDESLDTVLLNSIETIADNCFRECNKLELGNMPNLKSIGNNCFVHCFYIDTLKANNLEIIGDDSFFECRDLKNIIASNLKSIGSGTFCFCKSLKSVSLPELIEIGKHSFTNCDLNSIYMPKLKQSRLSEIQSYYPQTDFSKTGGIIK